MQHEISNLQPLDFLLLDGRCGDAMRQKMRKLVKLLSIPVWISS